MDEYIEPTDAPIKRVVFAPPKESSAKTNKTLHTLKPKPFKKETQTWNVTIDELQQTHQMQLLAQDDWMSHRILVQHIRHKLAGYKQQDVHKHHYCVDLFVTLDGVRDMLVESQCICHYCSDPVLVLYEHVLEHKQWTLDRIDNQQGHNKDNVVIACLRCNLKRRCTNKEAFRFAKQLVVVKTL